MNNYLISNGKLYLLNASFDSRKRTPSHTRIAADLFLGYDQITQADIPSYKYHAERYDLLVNADGFCWLFVGRESGSLISNNAGLFYGCNVFGSKAPY